MSSVQTDTQLPHACAFCVSRHKSLFANLDDPALEMLGFGKSCTRYKKGQALIYEGTRPLGVFCVHSGLIKVFQQGEDGKEQIIKISGAGDLLGYKALISQTHYKHTAEVLEDSSVCFIPKDEFLQLLKPGATFYMDLLKALCEEHSELSAKMTEMSQKSVRQRLAITLLMLRDTYGREYDTHGDIEINLSREDLANIVGTATESLIRLLNEFKKEGAIEVKGRKIRVVDADAIALATHR